jgi:16S rRNA processing protein RimM
MREDGGDLSADGQRVLLGAIKGAHGVRGDVLVVAFTDDPGDIAAYGALSDEAGARTFELTLKGESPKGLIARIAGVTDREAAQALKGTGLYVPRERLPATADEDEFYLADLIGLPGYDPAGTYLGHVRGIADFGAGDVLDLVDRQTGEERMVPFTLAAVPEVRLAEGWLRIVPPPELEAGEAAAGDGEGTAPERAAPGEDDE